MNFIFSSVETQAASQPHRIAPLVAEFARIRHPAATGEQCSAGILPAPCPACQVPKQAGCLPRSTQARSLRYPKRSARMSFPQQKQSGATAPVALWLRPRGRAKREGELDASLSACGGSSHFDTSSTFFSRPTAVWARAVPTAAPTQRPALPVPARPRQESEPCDPILPAVLNVRADRDSFRVSRPRPIRLGESGIPSGGASCPKHGGRVLQTNNLFSSDGKAGCRSSDMSPRIPVLLSRYLKGQHSALDLCLGRPINTPSS